MTRAAMYEAWHGVRWPQVEMATGPVDVVHATTLIIPPSRAPLVVTVHDLAFLDDPTRLTSRGNRFMRRGVVLAKAHAQLVVCSSEATKRDCIAAGFEEDRLRVVLLGSDEPPASLDDIAATKSELRLRHPYVVWVGTVEPRKNLPTLLEAFALVAADDRDIELVLVGPEGWGPQLDALSRPLDGKTRARVRALGFVTDEQRRAVVAGAAAFCYPSTKEGFGLPVLEAMIQGTPVVTSAGTSTEEVAAGAGLLVDPASPRAIADALRDLLDDASLADRLSSAGRARATELTWARCAERTLALYAELAAERSQ
jgi:glycosyltransferase involved in cell wall biosynthesis